ncbi:MAG TPA: carbohydrate ABC transporter permease, partial [Candidatus Limnocylindrales bacterium]|nr:carbohydrate ABC transporter permease [Candidatus Limnocylindrales bacterium]
MATAEATIARTASARRLRFRHWRRAIAWLAMGLLIFVTLFPFYWVVRTALSNNRALAANASSILPVEPTLGGFKRALGLSTIEEAQAEGGSGASVNFAVAFRNSVINSTLVTLGTVTFSAMAGYAFARLRFWGRDKLFYLILAALMVPPIFTTLPNFVLIKDLGLLNTFPGLVAPYLFMTPFAVFFMRQFFLGISREVEEAAFLDGSSRWSTFWRIILPMSSSSVATLALLTFIEAWNNYLWPLLIGKGDDVRVLTVALGVFRAQTPQTAPDWGGLMAATVVTVLPMIL